MYYGMLKKSFHITCVLLKDWLANFLMSQTMLVGLTLKIRFSLHIRLCT